MAGFGAPQIGLSRGQIAGMTPPAGLASKDPAARARAQAEEFEQVFLHQLLSSMFEGLSTDGVGGGGHAEEQWRGLQVDNYARLVTRSGGLGVADGVYREMLRLQEGATR